MTAPPRSDYDLELILIKDSDLNPTDWSFKSAFNPKTQYRLISREPLDHFDIKQRFFVKLANKTYYAYCAEFNTCSGSMQEDLLADFLYLKSLAKRYPSKFIVYDDICIEQTQDVLRLICIHQKTDNQEIEIDQCIGSKVQELIQNQVLISTLVKLIQFLQQLRDTYYYDYELNSHNIMVIQNESGQYDVCLINQLLPLQYRLEYIGFLHEIYEEDDYELNETLIVKKLVFLFLMLAMDEDLADYKGIKALLSLWKEKKLMLPKMQIKFELLKLSLAVVSQIENKKQISMSYLIDRLQEIEAKLKKPEVPSSVADKQRTQQETRNARKKGSQGTLKSQKLQSENESSQFAEEEEDEDNSDEDKDDFGCVPANNMDNETVHIKMIDDDVKQQKSIQFMIETDQDNNGYQSDAMRSLGMLGGGANVTVKKSKYEDPNNIEASSTIIDVKQIRVNLPSSRGGQNKNILGSLESDREINPSVESPDEEDAEAAPKYLEGAQIKNILLKSNSNSMTSQTEEVKQPERVGIVSNNFNAKRENSKYKNYALTFIIRNAHSDKINCLCHLFNGIYASGSSDKTIKVWNPLDQKPIGILEEDNEVTLMLRLGKTQQNDVTMLYVAVNVLRFLSLKQQRAVQLFKNDKEITAICKVIQSTTIIAIGTANGMIKDFDIKSKCVIRRAKLHNGSKVTSIVSQGKYLISTSENGIIAIYDYVNQQEFRELKTNEVGIRMPTSLNLLKGDRFLAISEESGLAIIDIERAIVAIPNFAYKDVHKLVKLGTLNETGRGVFAGCTTNGQLKVFTEGGEGDDVKWIDQVKSFRAHQGSVADVISLTNGAIISCGSDKSIALWEERKSSSQCGCCNII